MGEEKQPTHKLRHCRSYCDTWYKRRKGKKGREGEDERRGERERETET